MVYIVSKGTAMSDEFRARMGVLMGDPASPTLWILFMHDLKIIPHDNDFTFTLTVISHLEHADNILLICGS